VGHGVKLTIPLNDGRIRCGEGHGRAKLTDGDVERMRTLREEGMSLGVLAAKFDISRRHVIRICTCRSRAVTATRFKHTPLGGPLVTLLATIRGTIRV
jgi:hypothetical protein